MWPFSTTVHHEITVHPDALTRARLEAILTMVRDIKKKVEKTMTTEEANAKFDTLFSKIGEVGGVLSQLRTDLAAAMADAGIPGSAEGPLFARVDEAIAALDALKNPTPAPTPTE